MEKEVQIGLVTGASSGMGRYMASMFCEKGHIVYVVARRLYLLKKLKQECRDFDGEIRIISGDLKAKIQRTYY